jgi:hypothetical protein
MDPIIKVTTEPVPDPQTPTPTHYQQVAAQLMTALDDFVTAIPKLDESETVDAKEVRRNLGVTDAFCLTAISAAEQLPELKDLRDQYAEKGRNRLQYIEAVRLVDDKLTAVSERVKHVVRMNKSAVSGDALDIYRITQARAKRSRNPALAAFAAAMKRDLGKTGLSKADREERATRKFNDAVEKEVLRRLGLQVPTPQQKEVPKAA